MFPMSDLYPKHERLLRDLAKKTDANSINWEGSEVTDQFVLKLRTGAIMFDKSSRAADWNQVETYYSFKILNKVGNAIDEFNIDRGEAFVVASRMFDTIRRRVNRIDEQLDEIIGELDDSGTT
jgi:hypothetical protein